MVGCIIYMVEKTVMRRIWLVLWLSMGVAFANAQEWKLALNDTVPNFKIENKEGQAIDMQALRGKVVFLNFFATWCPSCRAEMPHIEKEIWEKWGKRADFEVMALAREQGWDKLEPFMKKIGYTFPVYPDHGREVFSLFAESYIPRNVVVNKKGEIIYQSIGFVEEEFAKLVQMIEVALNEDFE